MSMKHVFLGASALAIAATAMPVAHAASTTTLFGGGGTLAAKLYRYTFDCYSAQNYGIYGNSLGNPSTAPYPSAVNSSGGCTASPSNSVALAYEPVGSGAGQNAFTTGQPSAFGLPASTNPVAWVNTSAVVATPPSTSYYPEVEFAGTDAYLSAAQISAAASFDGGAATFEVPTVVTPITLPIGEPATTRTKLAVSDVCDIFSGQESLNADGKAVVLAVRLDGSGTSYIFSDWLSQNCIGKSPQLNGQSYAFNTTNGFPSTKPSWMQAVVGLTTGKLATVQSFSGSGGIATFVNANAAPSASASVIGYLSPDYTNLIDSTDYPSATPAYVGVSASTAVQPTFGNTAAHASAAATPTSYANNIGMTLNEELVAPALNASGYPIVGYTFIETYGCYSGTYGHIGTVAKGNLLKSFLTATFNGGSFSTQANAIVNKQGFAGATAGVAALLGTTSGPLGSKGINGSQCPGGRT